MMKRLTVFHFFVKSKKIVVVKTKKCVGVAVVVVVIPVAFVIERFYNQNKQ